MNEKIKELAIKSWLVSEHKGKLLSCYREDVDLTKYLEEFAELLIEEALCVVDMPLIERNEIRKHFGIKEEPMPVKDIGLVTTRDWTK